MAESHEEANPLDAFDVEGQRLQFLVVQQIHVLFTDLRKVVHPLDFHRLGFYPLAVFPVAAVGCYFPDVDFGIEVCSERIAMVTGICIQDVDIVNFVKIVLLRVS